VIELLQQSLLVRLPHPAPPNQLNKDARHIFIEIRNGKSVRVTQVSYYVEYIAEPFRN
jgi:hypothetical protein